MGGSGVSAGAAGPPVVCPYCACERISVDGAGIGCVCHSCGAPFHRDAGRAAWREIARPLTGDPDELEVGDVLAYMEDPDRRPYLWDMEE